MDEQTTGLNQTDEVFAYEVSDEALEAAACTGRDKAGALTLAFCSGVWTCPTYLGGWACY